MPFCLDTTLLVILCLSWVGYASLSNVTVDDNGVDLLTGAHIVYNPPGFWQQGRTCKNCTADVDANSAYDLTWHDGTYYPQSPDNFLTMSFQFQGSALYVFCIIAHTSTSPDGNSDMTFYLDGQHVGDFILPPNNSTTYDYHFPVYVNESIPDGTHSFVLQNGRSGGSKSLVLFDNYVYSTNSSLIPGSSGSEATPPSKNHFLSIVLSALGGAAVLVLLLFGMICWLRRRNRRRGGPQDITKSNKVDLLSSSMMANRGFTSAIQAPPPIINVASPLNPLASAQLSGGETTTFRITPFPMHGTNPQVTPLLADHFQLDHDSSSTPSLNPLQPPPKRSSFQWWPLHRSSMQKSPEARTSQRSLFESFRSPPVANHLSYLPPSVSHFRLSDLFTSSRRPSGVPSPGAVLPTFSSLAEGPGFGLTVEASTRGQRSSSSGGGSKESKNTLMLVTSPPPPSYHSSEGA